MVGIAIINFRTYQKTIECISSIRKTTQIPYKIYLLDNGSGNESATVLKEKYKDAVDLKLIISEENLGYAKGNNLCIQYMNKDRCEYGVISNNDIICKLNTIEKLVKDLKDNPKLLLVGPKTYSPSMEFQCSAKENNIQGYNYLLNSMYISFLWNKRKLKKEDKWNFLEKITEAKWISGAFFAFSMSNMQKIEMFDPKTFLFFEEAILANKATKFSLKMAFDPNAVVIHDHAFSTGGGLNIVSKIAEDKSEQYYFNKYVKAGKVFMLLLKLVRKVEVVYSYGKRKRYSDIKKYFEEMNKKAGE